MWFIILVTIIVVIFLKIIPRVNTITCTSKADLSNKTVIVTGANTGIGLETAKGLAKLNARVILACRDVKKGQHARDEIIKATNNNNVELKLLDLASFKSVRSFANEILETEKFLHILINNAGMGKLDNSLTEDGLPIEVQVNHFGPFLLTMLLLPLLKRSAPSRVVNVASIMYTVGRIDVEVFDKKVRNRFEHMRLYSNTKLANMLSTWRLSQILEGTGVTVNCLHPGAVNTEIFRHQPVVVRYILRLLFKTPWEGAQTSLHVALSPELDGVSGRYYSNCNEVKPWQKARDDLVAEQLWKLSEKWCKLN